MAGVVIQSNKGTDNPLKSEMDFRFERLEVKVLSEAFTSWGLKKCKITEGVMSKGEKVTTVQVAGKFLKITTVQFGKVSRKEIEFNGIVIPKTVFYNYLALLKHKEVNTPQEVQIFDELTLTLHKVKWTYLGHIKTRWKVWSHQFELRESLKEIITYSEKNQLLGVKNLTLGFGYHHRQLNADSKTLITTSSNLKGVSIQIHN